MIGKFHVDPITIIAGANQHDIRSGEAANSHRHMNNRRSEKLGWTLGWLGGFIWVAALSSLFFWQGRWLQGASGALLIIAAIAVIHQFAPWRWPKQPYWKLMLAPYSLFFIAIAWVIWAYGGLAAAGLDAWSLLWLLPLLLPFGTLSRQTWADGEPPLT